MNAREVASVVAVIAAAYPQWNASAETVSVYADALADLDVDDVTAAVRELLLVDERWPTIATIRRTVARRSSLLAPAPIDAWTEVAQTAGAAGRFDRPEWSHQAIETTVRAIGWWALCQSTNPDTLRAQFLRLYDDARTETDRKVIAGPAAKQIDTPVKQIGSIRLSS